MSISDEQYAEGVHDVANQIFKVIMESGHDAKVILGALGEVTVTVISAVNVDPIPFVNAIVDTVNDLHKAPNETH